MGTMEAIKLPTRYCTGYCLEQLFEEQPWGDMSINCLEVNRVSRTEALYRWQLGHRERVKEIARISYYKRRDKGRTVPTLRA